jgi:hypothetical protein
MLAGRERPEARQRPPFQPDFAGFWHAFCAKGREHTSRYYIVKVIVQDLETMRFLSGDGRWVADREDARDFYSLLPAYYFARDNTSRHFQVVLYCPEDHFCASIIAGKGIAQTEVKHPGAQTVAVKVLSKHANRRAKGRNATRPIMQSIKGVYLPAGFDDARRHLN